MSARSRVRSLRTARHSSSNRACNDRGRSWWSPPGSTQLLSHTAVHTHVAASYQMAAAQLWSKPIILTDHMKSCRSCIVAQERILHELLLGSSLLQEVSIPLCPNRTWSSHFEVLPRPQRPKSLNLPIWHLWFVLFKDKYILRFDISMNYVAAVDTAQAFCDVKAQVMSHFHW
jgi:hypothetical protein